VETNVTWQTPWQSGGAAGAEDVVSDVSSSVFIADLGAYSFPSTSNLVADVQAWVSDPGTNFGWTLRSAVEGSQYSARLFASRESTGPPRPRLTITFVPPPQITNLQAANGVFQFLFAAESNRAYTVEHRAALDSGSWLLLTNFPASSTTLTQSVTDALDTTNRFYRVRSP